MRCGGFSALGRRCKNVVAKGKRFCHVHDKRSSPVVDERRDRDGCACGHAHYLHSVSHIGRMTLRPCMRCGCSNFVRFEVVKR